MQAGGKARLGNSHNQKPPLHGGHSLFLYLPLPSLQSNSSWPFRDETKKKKKKKACQKKLVGAAVGVLRVCRG